MDPIRLDLRFARVVKDVGRLDFNQLQKPVYVALMAAILTRKLGYAASHPYRVKLYKLGIESQAGPAMRSAPLGTPDRVAVRRLFSSLYDWSIVGLVDQVHEHLSRHPLSDAASVWQLSGVVDDWIIQQTLLISGLDPDILPTDDPDLRRKLQVLFQLAATPTAQEADDLTQEWSPYRSYYTWYLWAWRPDPPK